MTPSTDNPEADVQVLEEQANNLREELGDLVGELDKRRHRLTTPLLIGGATAAGLVVAGLVIWRVRRHRPSRLENLTKAVHRATEGEQPPPGPSVGGRILGAAAAAAAGVLVRHFAPRLFAERPRPRDPLA